VWYTIFIDCDNAISVNKWQYRYMYCLAVVRLILTRLHQQVWQHFFVILFTLYSGCQRRTV